MLDIFFFSKAINIKASMKATKIQWLETEYANKVWLLTLGHACVSLNKILD